MRVSPLKSFLSESALSSCLPSSCSFPAWRRLTPAWDNRFFSWLQSRSSSDWTTLGLNLSAYVLQTQGKTLVLHCFWFTNSSTAPCWALTPCWWRVFAAAVWRPPSGQCWAETRQVFAGAGGAAPAWSPSRRAGTAHWAAHWRWPETHPLAGSERSMQTQSPAGGAAELLRWQMKRSKKGVK